MKKILTGILAAALSVTAFAADEKKPAATPATDAQSADAVVIKIGDTEIHKSEFEAAIKSLPAEYQSVAAGPAKKMFAEEFVRMKMLAAAATKDGLADDPTVKAQLALMRDNAMANAEVERMQKAIVVSDADLQKAYDAQKSQFEKVKARHILIAFQGSPAAQPGKKELTDAEAKAKAEEIRQKLIKGADFAQLAKAESDDTASGARGGDLGTFGHGDMVPEFEKVAFEAKVNEFPPVVKTQYGYHVMQVLERTQTSLAEARPQLEDKVRQELLKAKLDAMKTTANVTYDPSYFAPPAPAASAAPAPAATGKTAPATKPAPKAPSKKN